MASQSIPELPSSAGASLVAPPFQRQRDLLAVRDLQACGRSDRPRLIAFSAGRRWRRSRPPAQDGAEFEAEGSGQFAASAQVTGACYINTRPACRFAKACSRCSLPRSTSRRTEDELQRLASCPSRLFVISGFPSIPDRLDGCKRLTTDSPPRSRSQSGRSAEEIQGGPRWSSNLSPSSHTPRQAFSTQTAPLNTQTIPWATVTPRWSTSERRMQVSRR